MDKNIQGIPIVKISQEGKFKYILIKVQYNGHTTYYVRGNKNLQYHDDNNQQFVQIFKSMGYKINRKEGPIKATKDNKQIKIECLGGGKKCFIYGYSKSFGRVDHQIAKKLISQHLGYKLQQIETSQQGY